MLDRKAIQVRNAVESDWLHVADLMYQALSPYYDGDHEAHARRILTTHLQGGLDRLGFFSAEQRMLVAEVDGEFAGLIHLVRKRQNTLKISPLIVSPDARASGVGTVLLSHAFDYAREFSARMVYCTVALKNESAQRFFSQRGFIRAGEAESHYKANSVECMLYKFLDEGDLDAFDRPHISVLPLTEKYYGQLKEILLRELPSHFIGVDQDWVDALISGYERRHTGDINQKYKLIYCAIDRQDRVVGVAGCTPKKGEPIKLMPLVALDEPAFFALLSDLPYLVADYGRKLYVHIVPTSRQTRFLQTEGWRLDAALPDSYQSGLVTQQWSYAAKENENMRTMRLKQKYLDLIRRGRKTLEVRVAYENLKSIKTNEVVRFVSRDDDVRMRIVDVRQYRSFKDMFEKEDHRLIIPDLSLPQVRSMLSEIYPPDREALGVIVLELAAG